MHKRSLSPFLLLSPLCALVLITPLHAATPATLQSHVAERREERVARLAVALSSIPQTVPMSVPGVFEEETVLSTSFSTDPAITHTTSGMLGESLRQKILDLVNAERDKKGVARLTLNSDLEESAQKHAEDMAANNYFSHTSRDGQSSKDRIKAAGYGGESCTCSKYYGENIARGQKTAAEVMRAWMNSSGHRKNILSANYKELGVGITQASNGQKYWVQNFGSIVLK